MPEADDQQRRKAELAKLRAETAKLKAEKIQLDSGRSPVEAENARAFAELAKLKAEKEKLEAEKEKLETEKEKLDADHDPVQANNVRAIAELAKLRAEATKMKSDARAEWLKTISTLALGAAALVTVYVTFTTRSEENEARYRADVARLIESLGHKEPALRAAAAIGLQSYLKNGQVRGLVIGSLTYGLGLETQVDVQQAMAEGLIAAGQDAVAPLRALLFRVNGEVEMGLSKLGNINCDQPVPGIEPIRAMQNGMIVAVAAISQINGGAARDFSQRDFKCFEFYRYGNELRAAIFRQSIVWDADFYGMDLHGSDFSESHARGAKFGNAQLEQADFDGADLTAADFRGATGLSEAQMRKAKNLYCAKFSQPLSESLKEKTPPPPGGMCP